MKFVPTVSKYFILAAVLSIMLPIVPLSINRVHANHINCTNWHGDSDVDCDGLSDAWEGTNDSYVDDTTGLTVALPGADPNHKDVYVEIDYMTHHVPPASAIDMVVAKLDTPSFEIYNPDGTYGVRLHYVIDDQVPDSPGGCTDVFDNARGQPFDSFDEYKAGYFGSSTERGGSTNSNFYLAKMNVYHYALFTHAICGNMQSSGRAEVPGNDFVVSLGDPSWGNIDPGSGHATGSTTYKAATFMHELGHNLGLKHAGTTDLPNCKPNYLSVMNYLFQFPVYLTGSNWPMDYSHNVLSSLKESALVENAGIGLAQPVTLKTAVGHTPTSHSAPHYNNPSTPPTANSSPINFNWWKPDGDTADTVSTSITNFHSPLLSSCSDTDVDNTAVGGKLFGFDDVNSNSLIFWNASGTYQNGTSIGISANSSEMDSAASGEISQIDSVNSTDSESLAKLKNNTKINIPGKVIAPMDILDDPNLPPCDVEDPSCQDSPCDKDDPNCVPNKAHNYSNPDGASLDVGNRIEVRELNSTDVLNVVSSKALNINDQIKSLNQTQFVNGTDVQKLKNDLDYSLVTGPNSVYSLINSSNTDQAMGKLLKFRSLLDGKGTNEIIPPPKNVDLLYLVDDLLSALQYRR